MRSVMVVLFGLAAAACGHDAATVDANTVDATPSQTITATQTLLGGMLVEGSWLAGPNDHVGLSLDTTAGGFDWDIHAHIAGGTQDLITELARTTVRYDFRPPEQGQWYLLLRNSTATTITIDIQMDLFGQAQWNGWQ